MTDKERVEQLKENAEHFSSKSFGDGGRDIYSVEKVELFKEDYDYLIQQVEEKQETEGQNQRLKKALEIYADERSYVTNVAGAEITPTVMIIKGEVAKNALKGV